MIKIVRNQTAAIAMRIYERFLRFVSLNKWRHE